eukprot:1160563-Pelagomonas_calceolata.AAC.13
MHASEYRSASQKQVDGLQGGQGIAYAQQCYRCKLWHRALSQGSHCSHKHHVHDCHCESSVGIIQPRDCITATILPVSFDRHQDMNPRDLSAALEWLMLESASKSPCMKL